MAENLDPIKQVIEVEVNENGTAQAKEKVSSLNKEIANTETENKKAEQSFKTLKVQLREAIADQQKLAQQYGATSTQAIAAARAVAGIRDEIGLQNDLVESFNPDDKFRALTQTAGIAALALGGVQDGLAALGIESKALDQVIGSAQAILGVTSAVSGMSDAYTVLTAARRTNTAAEVVAIGTTEALVVAEVSQTAATGGATIATTIQTAATWALNAAIAVLTSPILLVVAAIALLVGGIGYLTGAFGDFSGEAALAERASKKLSKEIDRQSDSFEKNSNKLKDNNDFKLKMRKASGATEEQLYKETKALRVQELQLARNNEAQALLNLKKAIYANQSDPNDLNAENQKKAQEAFTEAKKAVAESAKEIKELNQERLINERQAETDARNKRIEDDKKAADARKEKIKKNAEEHQKEIDAAAQRELDAAMKSANDAIAILDGIEKSKETPAQKETREFEEKKLVLEANNLSIEELERQHLANLAAIKEEQRLKDEEAELDFRSKEAEEAIKRTDEQNALDAGALEQKQKNKEDILATGDALIEGAKLLGGKNKAIQKAAIITEGAVSLGKVGVNIATGVSKDAASGAVASVPQIIKTIATGAVSTASIIANTARALKAVGGGGGSGGGESPLPSRNVAQVGFQASSENQIGSAIAAQQKNQPPIEAFVVSQSVKDAEELNRKKELNNSF